MKISHSTPKIDNGLLLLIRVSKSTWPEWLKTYALGKMKYGDLATLNAIGLNSQGGGPLV